MFWVVDNFLMKKHRTKAKLEEREEDSRGNSKVRYRRALSHDDSESEVSLAFFSKRLIFFVHRITLYFDCILIAIYFWTDQALTSILKKKFVSPSLTCSYIHSVYPRIYLGHVKKTQLILVYKLWAN